MKLFHSISQTILLVSLLSWVAGCGLLGSNVNEPALVIEPSIIDFSKVGTSGRVQVAIRNTVNEPVSINGMFVNAEGFSISGITSINLPAKGYHNVWVVFNYNEFRNAPNVRLTIQTNIASQQTLETPILVPSAQQEIKLTGEAGVNSKRYHIPIKFSANGTTILYNAQILTRNPSRLHFEAHSMSLFGDNKTRHTFTPDGNSYGVDITTTGDRILFYTDKDDGPRNIYVWSESGIDTLTNDAFVNTPVSFSPDGNSVLFNSNRNGNWDVFLYNLQSKARTPIADETYDEFGVRWASNGSSVLLRAKINGADEILLSSLIGRPLRLTNSENSNDIPVDLSPSSTGLITVLFYSDRNYRREIYTMTTQGDVLQLTNNQTYDFPVRFSHDGSKILFFNRGTNNNSDIYIMDSRGGLQSIRRITSFLSSSQIPVDITIDNQYVLFYSERAFQGSDVFIVRTNLDRN